MRTGVSFIVSPTDRRRLTGLVKDSNTPQKHVWRAEMMLLSAEGAGTMEIMRRTGKSKTCVWRWQERFAEEASTGSCATRRGRRASRRLATKSGSREA